METKRSSNIWFCQQITAYSLIFLECFKIGCTNQNGTGPYWWKRAIWKLLSHSSFIKKWHKDKKGNFHVVSFSSFTYSKWTLDMFQSVFKVTFSMLRWDVIFFHNKSFNIEHLLTKSNICLFFLLYDSCTAYWGKSNISLKYSKTINLTSFLTAWQHPL